MHSSNCLDFAQCRSCACASAFAILSLFLFFDCHPKVSWKLDVEPSRSRSRLALEPESMEGEELELGLEARLGKQHSKHASDDRI